jgi:hypothetical protein
VPPTKHGSPCAEGGEALGAVASRGGGLEVAVAASWAGDGVEGGGRRNTEDVDGAEAGSGPATRLRAAAPWL